MEHDEILELDYDEEVKIFIQFISLKPIIMFI